MKQRNKFRRKANVAYWRLKRWFRRNQSSVLGAVLLLLPIVGVLLVTGLPGSKTPTFVNLAVRANCMVGATVTIHIQIPDKQTRYRDLKNSDSQARVAIQLVPTLSRDDTLVCTQVSIESDAELTKPTLITSGSDIQTAPPLWFYIDAAHRYGEESVTVSGDLDTKSSTVDSKSDELKNCYGEEPITVSGSLDSKRWKINLEGDELKNFAGAITFELPKAVENASISTATMSLSLLLQGIGQIDGQPVTTGASIVVPPDHRIVQDLSIPAPVNVLATNRGPRYEFTLKESGLGNAANVGHWVSFHAVMEDTVWAKWQEYLLFVFSGLFGFSVGFFFEAILSRRGNGCRP